MSKKILIFIILTVMAITACGKSAKDYVMSGGQKAVKGDSAGAIADYTKAIEMEPDNAGFYVTRAVAYNMDQQYSLALQDYQKAIELEPSLESGLRMQMDYLRELSGE